MSNPTPSPSPTPHPAVYYFPCVIFLPDSRSVFLSPGGGMRWPNGQPLTPEEILTLGLGGRDESQAHQLQRLIVAAVSPLNRRAERMEKGFETMAKQIADVQAAITQLATNANRLLDYVSNEQTILQQVRDNLANHPAVTDDPALAQMVDTLTGISDRMAQASASPVPTAEQILGTGGSAPTPVPEVTPPTVPGNVDINGDPIGAGGGDATAPGRPGGTTANPAPPTPGGDPGGGTTIDPSLGNPAPPPTGDAGSIPTAGTGEAANPGASPPLNPDVAGGGR